MTKNEFAEGISLMTAAVGREMPTVQLQAWYALLNDLSADQLRKGVVGSLRAHEFAGYPTVASIRKHATAGDSGSLAAPQKSLVAWQAVRDAIRRVGAYESPDFQDTTINAVIREMGGWITLCDTQTDEMHWTEQRFCKTYAALSACPLPDDQKKRLFGITEQNNRAMRHLDAPTRVVSVRCLTVQDPLPVATSTRIEGPDKQEPAPANLLTDLASTLPMTQRLEG